MLRRAVCCAFPVGKGHHRGPTSHHAADFDCAVGTGVVAVFDGIVEKVCDERHVGGAHVDLLTEANALWLRRVDGCVAVYLHLAPGSACVKAGDVVTKGSMLAASGTLPQKDL
jgi:hypothetical protein